MELDGLPSTVMPSTAVTFGLLCNLSLILLNSVARQACPNRADCRLIKYYKHRHGEYCMMRYLTDVEKRLCEFSFISSRKLNRTRRAAVDGYASDCCDL